MSSKERFLYIAIIFFIALWFLYPGEEEYVIDYTSKIDKLEKKVDSLHSINGELAFKIDTLNIQISKLDQQIGLKDNRIKTLKWKINEKVNAVDSFNDDELTRFFTDRYGQYLDSIKKTNSKVSN